jgi:hypothetical protein
MAARSLPGSSKTVVWVDDSVGLNARLGPVPVRKVLDAAARRYAGLTDYVAGRRLEMPGGGEADPFDRRRPPLRERVTGDTMEPSGARRAPLARAAGPPPGLRARSRVPKGSDSRRAGEAATCRRVSRAVTFVRRSLVPILLCSATTS